jgi:glutamate-1-semialdehyde 2,1-aminomutase
VFDSQGGKYLDYVLGSGPLVLGHAHPAVVEAIQEQTSRGTQYYTLNPPALELAERIIDAVPCAERVKFTSTGAEATFQALRLARAFTDRDTVLRFGGAYHGHHDYGMSGNSAGIPAAVESVIETATFNDTASVAEIFARRGEEIAAVIVEPIQRIIPPRPGFLAFLREACTSAGALLIFDEVVTGFRLSRGGAQEAYGVTPDLATYGKVIGGGLALAAVAGRADVLELANPRRPGKRYVYFSGTLNGNPLSAAAGNATLRTLDEENGYDDLNALGRELRSRLSEISAKSPLPLRIIGDGPIAGVIFAEGDPLDPATLAAADRTTLRRLETELLRQGLFTNLAAKLYLSVAHTPADIDTTCDAFTTALDSLSKEDTDGNGTSV